MSDDLNGGEECRPGRGLTDPCTPVPPAPPSPPPLPAGDGRESQQDVNFAVAPVKMPGPAAAPVTPGVLHAGVAVLPRSRSHRWTSFCLVKLTTPSWNMWKMSAEPLRAHGGGATWRRWEFQINCSCKGKGEAGKSILGERKKMCRNILKTLTRM